MLYVLFVQSGRELQIIEELRCKKITAYCPRQLKAERRRGNWQYVERIIFTGYVFIDVPEFQPCVAQRDEMQRRDPICKRAPAAAR